MISVRSSPISSIFNHQSAISNSHSFEYGDGLEDVADDVGDVLALDFGLRSEDEAVAQHRERDLLHVLVREEVPPLQRGAGAGAAEQVERGPRARSECDVRVPPALLRELTEGILCEIGVAEGVSRLASSTCRFSGRSR